MGVSSLADFLPKYASMLTRCPHLAYYLEISKISKPEFTLIIKNNTSSPILSVTGETPVITNTNSSLFITTMNTEKDDQDNSLLPLETVDDTPSTLKVTQNLLNHAQSHIETGSFTSSTRSDMSKYFQTPSPE